VASWLSKAYEQGLRELDTDFLRRAAVDHVYAEEERLSGVISPSLVAVKCRLQRLKRFLGHSYQPGGTHMAVRAGEPDSVTQLNFLRGFQMEGIIITAIRHSLGDRVLSSAPLLHALWKDEALGVTYAGHPDMLVIDEDGQMANVQIKCPSVFKFDRMEKNKADAAETYLPQMATEMYILRKQGFPVARTYLFAATWEATAKYTNPRSLAHPFEWEDDMATIPETIAREILDDAAKTVISGEWPEALPQHQWDSFPCSYCSYSRLQTLNVIGCESQWAWQNWEKADATSKPDIQTLLEQGPAGQGLLAVSDQKTRRVRPGPVSGPVDHGSPPRLRVVGGTDS
jgi:hypothetical protein